MIRASEEFLSRRYAVVLWMAVLIMPAWSWASHLDGTIAQALLLDRLNSGQAPLVVDVRTPGEFQNGHVPGAVNIPLQELHRRMDELHPYRDTELVLYCESGVRAGHAGRMLQQRGFTELRSLEGHMSAWRNAELPAER